jgi:uncharacterized protein
VPFLFLLLRSAIPLYLFWNETRKACPMLVLTATEKGWLDEYRAVLEKEFPGVVEQLLIFGSKARGTATEDSDLDVLLILREGDWRLKEAITKPGYMLSIETGVVPSFLVYTREEWEARRQGQAPIWQTITRDGVAV